MLVMNDINNHVYQVNRTIYFDPRLDAAMVENLNKVFAELHCLEIINWGALQFRELEEEEPEDHVTLEELTTKRLREPNRQRMLAYIENPKLKWPSTFTEPGNPWSISCQRSKTHDNL